ncbi:hypothetical protein BDV95DRAFT_624603 [Massariosphaeria phaeospora]|uniref:2,6-dihydroxypyridine 3-monooxygenase substrate binding domain-containing protein n=1 Tax=Massariosphaeria phaeospora TaxID=100035 RepID=A0A7C8MVF9_9PLEO|nr:hypothetical protein BDV95DRAFT_624603 [Massariosphaeria phaeospora]
MGKTAVVIGGSIGGLMHGIMLKSYGYDVTILEKELSLSREGFESGIKIGKDITNFLKKHDRTNSAYGVETTHNYRMFDQDGKAKLQSKQSATTTNWGYLLHILRANFDGTVSKAVPRLSEAPDTDGKGEFKNGARVTDIKDLGNKVLVQYEDTIRGASDSISADLVIAADGTNSFVRNVLMPDVKRQYAGYLCWRGVTQEKLIDDEWNQKYSGKITFQFMKRHYLISYTIPTDDGELEPGKRLHNWVWYNSVPEDSQELSDIMTDENGVLHSGTVPRGLVRQKLWDKQQTRAVAETPPGIASIVRNCERPFITKIYDVVSPKAVFFGEKLFLVGDAMGPLRPNGGMGTNQVAYHCNLFEQVIEGKMTPKVWEKAVLRYGDAQRQFSVMMSSYGMGGTLSVMWNICKWLLLLLRQRLGLAR